MTKEQVEQLLANLAWQIGASNGTIHYDNGYDDGIRTAIDLIRGASE